MKLSSHTMELSDAPTVAPQTSIAPVRRQARQQPNLDCVRQSILTGFPLLCADMTALLTAVTGAATLADYIWIVPDWGVGSLNKQLLAVVAIATVVFAFLRLYPGTGLNPAFELKQLVVATTTTFLLLLIANFGFGQLVSYEISVLLASCCLALALVPSYRLLARNICSRFSWWGQPAIIIGGGSQATRVYDMLCETPNRGIRPVGIIDDFQAHWSDESMLDNYLGPIAETVELAARHRAYWAILPMRDFSEEALKRLESIACEIPNVVVLPNLGGLPSLWNHAQECAGQTGICVQARLTQPIPQLTKRASDILLILLSLPLLLPVVALISLLVKLDSKGPAFYRQLRIGKDGRRFWMWKFRSMMTDADAVLQEHLESDSKLQAEWELNHKLKKDPRVTRVGAFLRRTSLDELPQIWNVVNGNMSLVGPRPIVDSDEGRTYLNEYGDAFKLYCRVQPGITGLWQTSGRNNTTYEERIEYDSYYVRNWSPWLDLYIMTRTVKTVLFVEGAY